MELRSVILAAAARSFATTGKKLNVAELENPNDN
jgi:hypothetical protein